MNFHKTPAEAQRADLIFILRVRCGSLVWFCECGDDSGGQTSMLWLHADWSCAQGEEKRAEKKS